MTAKVWAFENTRMQFGLVWEKGGGECNQVWNLLSRVCSTPLLACCWMETRQEMASLGPSRWQISRTRVFLFILYHIYISVGLYRGKRNKRWLLLPSRHFHPKLSRPCHVIRSETLDQNKNTHRNHQPSCTFISRRDEDRKVIVFDAGRPHGNHFAGPSLHRRDQQSTKFWTSSGKFRVRIHLDRSSNQRDFQQKHLDHQRKWNIM